METGPPAAAQSHRQTDGLWGEAAGPWAGEPGEEVRGPQERVGGSDKATIVSRWQFSLSLDSRTLIYGTGSWRNLLEAKRLH